MDYPTELVQRMMSTDRIPLQVRTGLFVVSGVLAAGGLLSMLGPVGIIIALAGIAVGWRMSAVAGVVVFHSGAVVSEGLPVWWVIVLLESASILLLVADFPTLQDWRSVLALGGLTVFAGGSVLLISQSYGLGVTIVSITITASIVIYAGHRYEQYKLGLLNDYQ